MGGIGGGIIQCGMGLFTNMLGDMFPMACNVIGFMGSNLAVFSNVWNAFHCCAQEIGILDRLVSPLVSLMQGDK